MHINYLHPESINLIYNFRGLRGKTRVDLQLHFYSIHYTNEIV